MYQEWKERLCVLSKEFTDRFGIKSGLGPTNERGDLMWNRCWSGIRQSWTPAIENLLKKIKSKYILETADMDEHDPRIQVVLDQIKEKFGHLVVYYTLHRTDIETDPAQMSSDLERWIQEAQIEAASLDSEYGKWGRGRYAREE